VVTTEAPPEPQANPRPRRTAMRRGLAALLGFGLVLAATGTWLAVDLYRRVDRVDVALSELPHRPPQRGGADLNAVDIGLLGTADGRLLSLMVLHVDGDRRGARVTSLVDPAANGAGDLLFEAPSRLSGAGVEKAAEALETRSGVRLDHLAVFDWRLLSRLVGRLGGVDVHIDPAAVDDDWPEWVEVTEDLVPEFVGAATPTALETSAAATDRGRTLRQLALLDSVTQRTLHQELSHDPVGAYLLLHMVAGEVVVDDDWSTRDLATLLVSMRHLHSRDIVYEAAAPVTVVR
jgi:cell envelope-related transcriptional attenuator-like protein